VQVSEASWRASLRLHRMRALLWARVVESKLYALDRALKANFDPNQPRVPADGGQPKCIEWVANKDLPPGTLPDP
jgi:hypothetical protein